MLNTNFTPWPLFTKAEIKAVRDVLLSNKVNYWTGNECKRFEKQGFQIETTLGCEKTFFQSWSTFSKLSKFNSKIEIMFNFISIKKFSFLFYPYTFFLRLIDETLGKILPEDWSRTVLVVLDKKHD